MDTEIATHATECTSAELVEELLLRPWSEAWTLDAACVHSVVPVGKLFRPALLLNAVAAVGGDPAAVLPAAAAVELGHVGSLVHDDVMDMDTVRRGRPSVLGRYGLSTAVSTGDALIFALYDTLYECSERGIPAELVLKAVRIVSRAGVEMCRGQILEEELSGRTDVTLDSYLEVARLKTGALIRAACEVGAVLGGAGPEWTDALTSYGEELGLAFQMYDDVMPYLADSDAPDDSDERNCRPSLPVVLGRLMLGDETDEPETVVELLQHTGAVETAERMAVARAHAARDQIAVLPPSSGRDVLTALAHLAVNRES